MSDPLIGLYNQELTHLRRSAAEFAATHPVQAGRLRLTGDAVEDPHVARLMEAFAYIAARIRLKLEDDFPELTEALLGVLHPHYLAPLPSVAVVQMRPKRGGATEPLVLPAGTAMDSEAVEGERCRFRTCYPVTLWPLELDRATLRGLPIVAPPNPRAKGAAAVLHLSFVCASDGMAIAGVAPDTLRLFLRGAPEQVFPLYDLLAGHVLSVAVAVGAGDPAPEILGPERVRPVGFDDGHAVLPHDPRSAPGHRLLTEYFSYPEKFLFFDLEGLAGRARAAPGNRLDVFVYLDRSRPELERTLDAGAFALGCTPVVNLFPRRAEPIQLDHRRVDYRIVPDARRPRAMEVYAVERVEAVAPDGSRRDFLPFYGCRHGAGGAERYWHAVRRPAGPANPGSEMFVSLLDIGFNPDVPAGDVLSLDLTCLNRDLPARLPFGGGHPAMSLVQEAAQVASVSCLTPPARTVRPSDAGRDRWRLISHLSLNHLSLTDGAAAADHLRETLRLHDLRGLPETAALIEAVDAVRARPATARAPQPGVLAMCRGIDIDVDLDAARFSGTSALLLGAVLERFLAQHATVNTFTRTCLRAKDGGEVLKQWPARAGDRILL